MTDLLEGTPVVDVHCHGWRSDEVAAAPQRGFLDRITMLGMCLMSSGLEDERHARHPRAHDRHLADRRRDGRPAGRGARLRADPRRAWPTARAGALADHRAYLRRLWADAGVTDLIMDDGYPLPRIDGRALGRRGRPRGAPRVPDRAGHHRRARRRRAPTPSSRTRSPRGLEAAVARRVDRVQVGDRLPHRPRRGRVEPVRARGGLRRAGGPTAGARRASTQSRSATRCCGARSPSRAAPASRCTSTAAAAIRRSCSTTPGRPTSSRCSPPTSTSPIVLIHSGWPWVDEGAFVASILPHVYLDTSLSTPWASLAIDSRLEILLGIAPPAKVMYGSDEASEPEVIWLSALLAREALARVLETGVERAAAEPGRGAADRRRRPGRERPPPARAGGGGMSGEWPALRERFEAAGVRALAMTMVDNGGITRVKAVPVGAARAGGGKRRRHGLHLGRGRHRRPVRRRAAVRQPERRHAPDPRPRRRPRADGARRAGRGRRSTR